MNKSRWIGVILCLALPAAAAGCSASSSSLPQETAFPSYEEDENRIDLAEDSFLMYQKNNVMVASTAVFLFHEEGQDRISFNMNMQNGSEAPVAAMPRIENLVLEGEVSVKEIIPAEPDSEILEPGKQTGITFDLILDQKAEPEQLTAIAGMITVNDAEGNPLSEMQNFAVVLNKDKYEPAPEVLGGTTKVETEFAVYEIPEQVKGPDGELTPLYYMVQEETVRQSVSPDFMTDYFSVYVRDISDYAFYFDSGEVPAQVSPEALNDAIISWRCDPARAGEYLISDYKETAREKLTIDGKEAVRVVSDYVMADSPNRVYSDITFIAVKDGRMLSVVNSGYREKYDMFADAVRKVRETITFPRAEE